MNVFFLQQLNLMNSYQEKLFYNFFSYHLIVRKNVLFFISIREKLIIKCKI